MKVGGNVKAREFLESQPDFKPEWTIIEKYNSKAAALLRDKVSTESEGKVWSYETSPARTYQPIKIEMSKPLSSGRVESLHNDDFDGFQNSGQSNSRYSGFGNPQFQQKMSFDSNSQSEMLTGALNSLSMGWNLLSKGATSAAGMAKDLTSQTGTKAVELSETVASKIGEGKLLGGFGNLLNSATEFGQKSFSGINQFVKSTSLHGFSVGQFKDQYDDLSDLKNTSQVDESENLDDEKFKKMYQQQKIGEETNKLTSGIPSTKYSSNSAKSGLNNIVENENELGVQDNLYQSSSSSPSLISLEKSGEKIIKKQQGLNKQGMEKKKTEAKPKDDPWDILNS
uniref:Uncharacterized protein n=1 Tax=Meloidogyne javanica TaxID=6303 RepID=A0A915LRE6_MELJA